MKIVTLSTRKKDKAEKKGNLDKVAKYEKAMNMVKTNRDIYVKDLSSDEIEAGRQTAEIRKNTKIGTLLLGPVGGMIFGAAAMNNYQYKPRLDDVYD